MSHLIDRLSRANPVPGVTTSDREVDALVREVMSSSATPQPKRRANRAVVPLTVVLTMGVAGAAVAAVGGSILSPDSPDDPPIVAPRMTATSVMPLSGPQVEALEHERQAAVPVTDAGDYFAALRSPHGDGYETVYSHADGIVTARATDREVCIRYRPTAESGSTGSCLPTAFAKTKGAYTWMQCFKDTSHPQHRVVAGIVPDGVEQVRGERDGVTQATAPVDGNGFVLTTDKPIDTVAVGDARLTIGPIVC